MPGRVAYNKDDKALKDLGITLITLHLVKYYNPNFSGKVEKILKGSLDLIPSTSPSVKIQIMGGKVYLRCKG